jgi:hypothetical protein
MDGCRENYERFLEKQSFKSTEKLLSGLKPGQRILLIGRDESFLSRAHEKGLEILSTEPETLSRFRGESFQRVIIAHRLECIEAPGALLSAARGLLTERGKLSILMLCHGEKNSLSDRLLGIAGSRAKPHHAFTVEEVMWLLDEMGLFVDRNEVLHTTYPVQLYLETSAEYDSNQTIEIA